MATLLSQQPGLSTSCEVQGQGYGQRRGEGEESPGSQISSPDGALRRRNLPASLGVGAHARWQPPSPNPAMWQLKEPSKPKCVCAHTQFITTEHMANILTHVSRARKTNRERAARGSGPLRRGCAAAGPGPRGWGRQSGSRAGRGAPARPPSRAAARAPATPQPPGTCALAQPGSRGAAALQVSLRLPRAARRPADAVKAASWEPRCSSASC